MRMCRAITPMGLLLFLLLHLSTSAQALQVHHDLDVRLDLERSIIAAKDTLTLELRDEHELNLALNPHAKVESVRLEAERVHFRFSQGVLHLVLPATAHGSVRLSVDYGCTFDAAPPARPVNFDNPGFGVDGAITPQGIFLMPGSGWYPRAAQEESFMLTVRTPLSIVSVCSGALVEEREERGSRVARWKVDRSVEGLALAGGPLTRAQAMAQLSAHVSIPVQTYFSPANQQLSARYLEASTRHLQDFVALHGPYAFSKFAVVENFFPTGFGMPSYTLLGGDVLRLPFIPETSLRHEVAHNWWGNGVLVDWEHGNWCEGLTTYVADYLAKERESAVAGEAYRRQMLRDYALMGAGEDFPLIRFTSRTSPASHTIGYGKAMFVFHMLRRSVGDEAFWAGLRRVYSQRLFKPTTWDDFRAAFVAGGMDAAQAERFFAQWLNRPGAPKLELKNTHFVREQNSFETRGVLAQGDPAFALDVPLVVHTAAGPVSSSLRLTGRETPYAIRTEARPLRLEADPESHVFRLLDPQEIPATVNSLKGSDALVAVLCDGQPTELAPVLRLLLSSLGQGQAPLLLEKEITPALLAAKDVLYLGFPSTEAGRASAGAVQQGILPLLDELSQDEALALAGAEVGFAVYKRPKAAGRTMAFLVPKPGVPAEAVEEAARKITHYGKFSYLAFGPGARNTAKGIWEPEGSPLSVTIEERP